MLASDDPRGVVAVRHLSQRSYRKMRQNLVWAPGYNVAAIPLAAGVLAWAGFVLPMSVGAAVRPEGIWREIAARPPDA